MINMKKRFLSIALCIALIFVMIPNMPSAVAEEEEVLCKHELFIHQGYKYVLTGAGTSLGCTINIYEVGTCEACGTNDIERLIGTTYQPHSFKPSTTSQHIHNYHIVTKSRFVKEVIL